MFTNEKHENTESTVTSLYTRFRFSLFRVNTPWKIIRIKKKNYWITSPYRIYTTGKAKTRQKSWNTLRHELSDVGYDVASDVVRLSQSQSKEAEQREDKTTIDKMFGSQ